MRFLVLLALLMAAPVAADPRMERVAALWEAGDWTAAGPALRRLSREGEPAAETLLGVMAARGLGQPRNPAVAAAWYRKAARRGYRPAELALADAFRRGAGVPRDPARAAALEGKR